MYRQGSFSKTLLVVTIIAILATLANAQSGRRPEEPQAQDDTIKLKTEEVLLNVTVTDPYGHQAIDLAKKEFILAEDGQRQDMSSFVLSKVPLNVVMLLDASGSVIGELTSLRDAATRFIENLGPDDKVSVMEFHLKVELLQDWTTSKDDLRHSISWRFKPGAIPKQGGNTALFDSVYLAATQQLAKVQGRKAIILLTDGDDNASKATYDQALASVMKTGTVVYVVSKARQFIQDASKYTGGVNRILGYGRNADRYISHLEKCEGIMADLATRSGGQILSPLKEDEVKDLYAQVARELTNQYIITYVSKNTAHDGGYRHVNVYLTRPGYVARTREGYYAAAP